LRWRKPCAGSAITATHNGVPASPRQDPPAPPLRLPLPGPRPRNFRLADGTQADGDLFPAHLADRLPLRVLLHPHRHSVRLVLLHRLDPRPGAVPQQRAVYGLTVVLVPPVYELLPGPGLSPAGPWPWAVLGIARQPGNTSVRPGPRAHDALFCAAGRGHRSCHPPRGPLVSRQDLLLPGAGRTLRRSDRELSGVGRGGVGRVRRIPTDRPPPAGSRAPPRHHAPAPTGVYPVLR